jgi:ubiquinone/menaquinone biosynthesis C-methylase UbiE
VSTLFFPGRHLVQTQFQLAWLADAIGHMPVEIEGLRKGRSVPGERVCHLVFGVTSANQDNSRHNPLPFHIRAVGVDRFVRDLGRLAKFRCEVFGIPHYGHTEHFAEFTLKEIASQSEGTVVLAPENTTVACSTPEVIAQYAALGFSIAPMELAREKKGRGSVPRPLDIVRQIGESCGADWQDLPLVKRGLSDSSRTVFCDFPLLLNKIRRIYQDPLTTSAGDLTKDRDYNVYARGMNEALRLKYQDIRGAIRPGRIVDEGCADGGLLAEVAKDFRDSDLFGVDLSAELGARFQERKRSGGFGNVFASFHHRNLLDPLFEPNSVDTTICNSTLHELWSYANQEETVRAYLKMKFAQLRPGGRLVVRDVVGPIAADEEVLLVPEGAEETKQFRGVSRPVSDLAQMSTRGLFRLFAKDFLAEMRRNGKRSESTRVRFRDDSRGFRVSLATAAEFLSKKDYLDNWRSEMNEEFCFWSFPRWCEVLTEIGFRVIVASPSAPFGSRAYTNPWIVKNRYRGKVRLFEANSPAKPVPYPPTNMVLVAEKPN